MRLPYSVLKNFTLKQNLANGKAHFFSRQIGAKKSKCGSALIKPPPFPHTTAGCSLEKWPDGENASKVAPTKVSDAITHPRACKLFHCPLNLKIVILSFFFKAAINTLYKLNLLFY